MRGRPGHAHGDLGGPGRARRHTAGDEQRRPVLNDDARPRPGRPRDDTADEAILTAAIELLESHGYARTTVERIASRAGVGKQTIYRRWPSKAAVVIDAYRRADIQRVPVPDTGSVEQDLVEMLGQFGDVIADARVTETLIGIFADSRQDPALLPEFRRLFMGWRRDAIRQVLDRARSRGHLAGEVDIEIALDALWGPLLYRYLRTGEAPTPEHARVVVRQALRGIQS
ncbi:MAG TPA: TetR/AcrR family transcriptional regulator [Acidimicrobiia bacterium]